MYESFDRIPKVDWLGLDILLQLASVIDVSMICFAGVV